MKRGEGGVFRKEDVGQCPEEGSVPDHQVLCLLGMGPALEFPVSLMPLEVLKERKQSRDHGKAPCPFFFHEEESLIQKGRCQ